MNEVQVKKQAFLKEAGYFFKNASFHADEGDLQSCAGLILKALDKERRASRGGLKVLHIIKNNFDILLAGGQDHLKGKIFRIGHLGFVNDRDIISVISALESTLYKMGKLKTQTGQGIAKTISVLNAE